MSRAGVLGLGLLLAGAAPLAAQGPPAELPATLGYALAGHPALPPADRPAPPPVPWYRRDEVLHGGGSFLITLSSQYVLTDKGGLTNGRALPFAAGGTLALGLAKEVADSRRAVAPEFSWRDLAWDAAGVAAAVAVAVW